MTKKLFGTDGIRGRAGEFPMTPDLALHIGMAAGIQFMRGTHRHRVVIAKDTRLSGYMLETALTSGFIAVGMDVVLVGPMPTPAVAMLVKNLRADLGVMISASHNPYYDNGIKLFGPDGYKLSDKTETAIEKAVMQDQLRSTHTNALGRARRLEDAQGRYIEFAKATFPKDMTLDGLKIVVDCAHGAAYQVAPLILQELGAEVIAVGVQPDGQNINEQCGSTAPEMMCDTVRKTNADVGIALDGDADRVIICDEKGQLLDGDQVMAVIATLCHANGSLKGGGIVATQMSNMGFEKYLKTLDLKLIRTKVGDRYVVEEMRANGYNIGGEQSGHIIMSDYTTTGDGIIAALQVLAYMRTRKSPLSVCGKLFTPMPQLLRNVQYTGASPLDNLAVQQSIAKAEKILAGNGRIFIRKSGTEPLIRVMAEGEDSTLIENTVAEICNAMRMKG